MSTDLALVIGVVGLGFAFLSLVSAYSESSAPRMAALLAVVSGGLILYAVTQNPRGYAIGDLPDVFLRVTASLLN
jgi:hypothetical protein